MTKDEKTEYWKGIEEAYINRSETSWIKMAVIRKLQRQVANMTLMNQEPNKKAVKQDTEARPDSLTCDEGKIITLKHRNQLEEFHEHMQGLNKERKEMDNKLEGERRALASLMKIPRRATVEVRDNVHTLIFN